MAANRAEVLRSIDESLGTLLLVMDGYRVERERTDEQYQKLLSMYSNAQPDPPIASAAKPSKKKSKRAKKKQSGTKLQSKSSETVIDMFGGSNGGAEGPPEWRIDLLRQRATLVDTKLAVEALKFRLLSERKESLLSVAKVGPGWHRGGDKEEMRLDDIMETVRSDPGLKELVTQLDEVAEAISALEKKHMGRKEEDARGKQATHMENVSAQLQKKFQPYSLVDRIIRDPKTKEAYNITMFIDGYLEGTNESPNPFDLIYALRDELMANHAELSNASQIEASLEGYIFPQIYNKMMQNLDMEDDDKHLENQCKMFSAATQEQFSINPDLFDNALVPYYEAIAQLRTIYFAFSPTRKLYAIMEAVKAVYEVTGRLQPDLTVGGDDFIDVWVYVVLHAQIRNLASTVVYIQDYGNADVMDTELGYYFTSLELAYNFIKNLTPDKLKTNPHAAVTERPFVVAELERYQVFCRTDSHVDMLGEEEELSGYKLYVVEDWLKQPGRFYCTYLQKTGDARDVVHVAVLKTNETISPAQQTFLLNTFFVEKQQEGLMAGTCKLGAILHSKQPPALPAALVTSGNYDLELPRVIAVVNLRALGRDVDLDQQPPLLPDDQEKDVRESYTLEPDLPLGNAVIQMVKGVQIGLKHLGIFPWMCVVDGILSSIVTRCIGVFQKRYNQAHAVRYEGEQRNDANLLLGRKSNIERPQALPTNGVLCSWTWKCIQYRVQDFVDALAELGYAGVSDAIREHEAFSKLVREFQVASNALDDGLLSERTINSIVEKLKAKRAKEKAGSLAVETE